MCRLQKTISAVLVAAGSSTRMGFDKLSFDLGGETVLHRSIRAFDQCPQIGEIVLVAGKNRAFVSAALLKPHGLAVLNVNSGKNNHRPKSFTALLMPSTVSSSA